MLLLRFTEFDFAMLNGLNALPSRRCHFWSRHASDKALLLITRRSLGSTALRRAICCHYGNYATQFHLVKRQSPFRRLILAMRRRFSIQLKYTSVLPASISRCAMGRHEHIPDTELVIDSA